MCPLRTCQNVSSFEARCCDEGRETPFQRSFSTNRPWEKVRRSRHLDIFPNSDDTGSDTEDDDTQTRRKSCFRTLEQVQVRSKQLVFDFDGDRPVPRLTEPRGLFTILSTTSSHQGVRWPIECEVIKDEVQHIEWEPPEPEPFYQPTGYELMPVPIGEGRGKVVFCIDSATKSLFYTRSRVGGSRGSVKGPIFCKADGDSSTLVFESRFQSGNLQKAVQIGAYDYELTLRTDLYTRKHTQWFYFQVRNMKAGVTYRFTIINLMKSRSLYCLGMKPLLYSERAAKDLGVGWRRVGSDIKYYRNQREYEGKALYSLTWTCQFPYEGDTCYLAHCYPYTYSDLQRYLTAVTSDPATALHCKLRVLCRSLAGNAVHVLTITSPSSSREAGRPKRAVVVTARVHPGETCSSWVMEGLLDFLLSDSPDARLLRDTFVFKVVPMLNPDGVVVGNYRCSLAGRDLNRNYCTLLRDSFPCVWHTRNMVKRLIAEREVVLYCDFHGHSRKNNVFMYGCDNKKGIAPHVHSRVFPLMMSKNTSDKFSYKSCKFKVHRSKEGTGRIVMWKLGINNSYTMESTFGGSTLGSRKGTHFSTKDLKSLGYHFCDTLLDYFDPDTAKVHWCLTELNALLRKEIQQKLGREVDSDSLDNISLSDIESSTSGSNSTESDGLPAHLLYVTDKEIKRKKKHLKTRKERNKLRQHRVHSTAPKLAHQDTKMPTLISGKQLTVTLQEQFMTVENENKNRAKTPWLTKEIGQRGPPWIPASSSCTNTAGQIPLLEDKPVKKPQLESVVAAYRSNGTGIRSGQLVRKQQHPGHRQVVKHQQSQTDPQWQAPRYQAPAISAVPQRWLYQPTHQDMARPITVHQQSIVFGLDHTCVRGRLQGLHSSRRRSSATSLQPHMVPKVTLSQVSLTSSALCTAARPTQREKHKPPLWMPPEQASTEY